jgi:hypothetical protein
MKKTLGTVTTYHGNEHRYLRGHDVRIIAVIKNAAREDYDPDADDGYLTDEEDIARRGGVTENDRAAARQALERLEEMNPTLSALPELRREADRQDAAAAGPG